LDLLASDLLPPLPAAFLSGKDRDLLAPLTFVAPGDLPQGAPATVDRRRLAAALATANSAYGHPRADELAQRLADPETRVVVAGQQPGLFGGPLLTLSKMLAAARWADHLETHGQPAVAVFWVATEDHDFAEVASATFLTSDGLRTYGLGEDPEPLLPVGMRSLGSGLEEVYGQMGEGQHGDRFEDWLAVLQQWYRSSARFGEAFCRLMVHFMGERTPLLLDSMLPAVKEAEEPWLRLLVERREALEKGLAQADGEIESRGYPLQVHPQRGVSPLFILQDGERRRVEWKGADGYCLRGKDEICGPVEELAERLVDNPAVASPGVLARPVIQDAILGTTLQILGPGELSYMPQVAPVYDVLGVAAPHTTLRPQILILESHHRDKLQQLDLPLADLLSDRKHLDRVLAERSAGDPVGPVREKVDGLLGELSAPALAIDPNLERPFEKTREQILRSLDLFADKLTAAAARRDQVQTQRVELLREALFPLGKLQERSISSAHYPGKYGGAFSEALWTQMGLDPRRLQVIQP
jgi:bacillithiol biosynthesis cysteine-adding enzyme BshC